VQPPDGVPRLLDAFRARFDETVDGSVVAMRAEIPSYGQRDDAAFHKSLRAHVAAHYEAVLRSLEEQRTITREDLMFVRPAATQRARSGLPLSDFMHAFRIGHRHIWEALSAGVEDDETREAAIWAVGAVIDYINIASTHAAEVYVEVEQMLQAHGERVRRDLLEDLLAGRPPEPGPRLEAARAAGLTPDGDHVVVAAVAREEPDDDHALRSAGSAIARACAGSALAPLVVVRRDEIVVVAPAGLRPATGLAEPLREAQARLADNGLPLAVGVSTVQRGLDRVAAGYREASAARERLGAGGGVLALPSLSAFDYMTTLGGETAERLVSPRVREFVEEDLADDGALCGTLLEYVAADMNTKAAAERLFVHVNTARYRLDRIAERTGCDLRRVDDVLELIIAIRLARARAERR
jgi:sugar diacid utilization regulator